jgi:thioredoxin 1
MVEIKKFEADWCGPCRMLRPTFQKLEEKFGSSVKFTYINVDEKQELSNEYGVRNVPLVVIEKDGKEVQRVVGAHSELTYENILNNLI